MVKSIRRQCHNSVTIILSVLLIVSPLHVWGSCKNTPEDRYCRIAARFNLEGAEGVGPVKPRTPPEQCNYPNLWLIPGRADELCKRPGADRPDFLRVNVSTVRVTPEVIKLPGCFTITMDITIVNDRFQGSPDNYLGKSEYQWWNFPDFEKLSCNDASMDGCGGWGNNCYYCDICNNLEELERGDVSISSSRARSFAQQFKGIKCPARSVGSTHRLTRRFCFDDWRIFDEDGDCKFDFIKSENGQNYRDTLNSLRQVGFGTMIAKFKLAHNATRSQIGQKATKERNITGKALNELKRKVTRWQPNRWGSFQNFRNWYIQYRKNLWHESKYLPWLIYTNEVHCLKLTFDICDKTPTPVRLPAFARATYKGPPYQCISPAGK